MFRFISILICAFVACFPAVAKQYVANHSKIKIPYIQGQVSTDAELLEPQWQQATKVELNYVVRPFENTQPPVKTHALVFEDGQTLHVAFVAQDPNPQAINAFYRDRDKIWSDDLVGIKLDTFNDNRLAYQFFVNPLGIQIDAIENEMTGKESDSWDAIWQSKGKITAAGYQVEMAIPLRVLNFNEADGYKIWGAEFVRFYPRNDRYRISNTPTDRDNACTLCQLAEVEGFANATQGQNLAIIPTMVAGRSRSRKPQNTLQWDYEGNQDVGLDIKWGLTPEVSLLATFNPDFSQVEADAPQLSVNNTFALSFAEKRSFFLENADYFSSNIDLVYTRNISAPDYGSKVTGRIGQHTLGVFVANDATTSFVVPGNLGSKVASIAAQSTNMALRYRYDLTDDFSLGWVSTVREAESYHNYVGGLDIKYQITPQDTFKAQLIGSDTAYPDELYKDFCADDCTELSDLSEQVLRTVNRDSFADYMYRIDYRHDQRDWFVRTAHLRRGGDFRADLGFQSKVDRNTDILGAGYIWYNQDSWWNRLEVSGDYDINHDDNGDLLEVERELYLKVLGNYQSLLRFGAIKRKRVGQRQYAGDMLDLTDANLLRIADNTTLFSENKLSLNFRMRPSAYLKFGIIARIGDEIDFANNRLGQQVFLKPDIKWSIGKNVQLELKHTYSNLDVEGQHLFTANLSDARLTYQFDQRQFLRLIAIYSDIERNQANYHEQVDANRKKLGVQLLYSYKLNPLTKFFAGYSDAAIDRDDLASLTKSEQSIFMKFSYAWLQ